MNLPPPMKQDVRVAAVSLPCPAGRIDDNLEAVHRFAREASRLGADMAVFPELNLTGYTLSRPVRALNPEGAEIRRLSEMARQSGVTLLCGGLEDAGGGKLFAAHWTAFPNGAVHTVRKTHVNPVEKDLITPGDDVAVLDSLGCCFGIQLCYDAHFPELSTAMALAGAHILFLPHASPRGTSAAKADSWLRHLPARAFDNSVYVIAVNQAGDNGAGLSFPGLALVLDPLGRVAARQEGEGLLVADLKAEDLNAVRGHRMRCFLPHRRKALYARAVTRRDSGPG